MKDQKLPYKWIWKKSTGELERLLIGNRTLPLLVVLVLNTFCWEFQLGEI